MCRDIIACQDMLLQSLAQFGIALKRCTIASLLFACTAWHRCPEVCMLSLAASDNHSQFACTVAKLHTCGTLHCTPPSVYARLRFTSQGLMIDKMSHYDTMGKLTSNHSVPRQAMKAFFENYNKMPFLLGWHECRQLLFDALPPGTVHFDKQVLNRFYPCTCITKYMVYVAYDYILHTIRMYASVALSITVHPSIH